MSTGYRVPPYAKKLVHDLCRTSPLISIGSTLFDWVVLIACAVATSLLFQNLVWPVALALYALVVTPLAARQWRALENIVHEASHHNLARKHPWLNDFVANWFAARWVFQSIKSYRSSHTLHHTRFNQAEDPDRVRFLEIKMDDISRASALAFWRGVVVRLPRYIAGWGALFEGARLRVLLSSLLHAAISIGGDQLWPGFMLGWLLGAVVPFFLIAPILRLVAESEEHTYTDVQTEFSHTANSVGWWQRWFIHPHDDGYHLLHHLVPSIPHWRLHLAHWLLTSLDPEYRHGNTRSSIYEPVVRRQRNVKGLQLLQTGSPAVLVPTVDVDSDLFPPSGTDDTGRHTG